MKRLVLVAITILLASAALAQAAGKTVKVKSGSYSGSTSEKLAISFTIKNRKINGLKTSIGYNGKCGPGGGPGYSISTSGVKITRSGAFSAKITLKPQVPTLPSVSGTLSGKASGGTVKGTINDSKTAHLACNGYIETFTARKH